MVRSSVSVSVRVVGRNGSNGRGINRVNVASVRCGVCNRAEEHLEFAKGLVYLGSKTDCVAWFINAFAFDNIKNSVVEHVEDVQRCLFEGVLDAKGLAGKDTRMGTEVKQPTKLPSSSVSVSEWGMICKILLECLQILTHSRADFRRHLRPGSHPCRAALQLRCSRTCCLPHTKTGHE